MASEPALRVIMRRLREIMAEPGDGQTRLDKIVRQIAGVMVAEVCSIYLKRRDGSLELYASEGLKREAVHATRLNRNEGLVGRCAEQAAPINEPDAQSHPAFSYRPETGEEAYHSMLAVPVSRAGQVAGVLVVQNHTRRDYAEEDVEVLQATAMVVAELLSSGGVAGSEADIELSRAASAVIQGQGLAEFVGEAALLFRSTAIMCFDNINIFKNRFLAVSCHQGLNILAVVHVPTIGMSEDHDTTDIVKDLFQKCGAVHPEYILVKPENKEVTFVGIHLDTG